MSKKRILITSALPYINATKHLGTLVGCLLPADVYARYMRLRGHEVMCICGADEHGTATEISAAKAGLSPKEFCDKLFAEQSGTYAAYGLSFDYFGRTSSPQNHELTQHLAKRLEEKGLIEERVIKQVYSVDDGRFLPDRYIVGECPYCGYQNARGDQCDGCTRVLDPVELKNPRSAISGSKNLEVRESKHLFLLQSKTQDKVKAWLETRQNWPKVAYSIATKSFTEGIVDRCITRDLKWGVKVPKAGYDDKVFYVWFDAPIGYIAATKQLSDANPDKQNLDWKRWWLPSDPENVHYVQFMGKDNIYFHSVSFPSTLLGADEGWKTVDMLKGFMWINYCGGKFSTSQKRGVFLDQALEVYPADYWRYFLMANAPETDDSEFTWELFSIAINKELADLLGNLYSRVHKLCETNYAGAVPALGALGEAEKETLKKAAEALKAYEEAMGGVQFRRAVQAQRELWKTANEYMEKTAPWKLVKTDKNAAGTVLNMAAQFLRLFAVVSSPIIPFSCQKIAEGLGLTDAEKVWPEGDLSEKNFFVLPEGRAVKPIGILFNKIKPEDMAAMEARFGGAKSEDEAKQRGKELKL